MIINYLYKGNKTSNVFNNINNTKTNKNYVDDLLNKTYNTFLSWEKNKKEDVICLEIPKRDYKLTCIDDLTLNLAWNTATSYLKDYLYYSNHPSYDFLIGDTAVKIHGNYIQVGSILIPTYTRSNYFKNLSNEQKLTIYNISLTINEYCIAA